MSAADGGVEGVEPGSSSRRGIRRRWKVLLAALVVAASYLVFTAGQVIVASGQDGTRPASAAIVLGAAQYDGVPSPVLRARLDHAFDLYQRHLVPLIVVTGSRRPGDRFTEAKAGYDHLRGRGVPERALVLVDDGTSTWESLAAASRVLRERGATDVLLVTDPYHALRARGAAAEVGLDANVSPTSAGFGIRSTVRETLLVSVGRIVGYRRAFNWFG